MDIIQPNGVIGSDQPRVDGFAKVTGQARFGADHCPRNVAHAFLATAAIARGWVGSIDQRAARAVPGVLDILTHENVGKAIKGDKPKIEGGGLSETVPPLGSARVGFAGQIVAVAVAGTFEAARAAARALKIAYEEETPSASFDDPGAKEVEAKGLSEPEVSVGDFESAFAAAPVKVAARYETPAQHHNPMELFQTTCAWEGERLTVWESSQHVSGFQHALARQLGIKAEDVRILSPYAGGGFGSRGHMGQSTALVALAARRLGRPVKLVLTRQQGFTQRAFRAETRHHVRIGAERDGRLTALCHDGWELTSRSERFATIGSDSTVRLYACPNVRTKVVNVEADRQSPGFMRAPPETPYLFAMESAMDELARALEMDPLELRRRNDTMHEPIKGLPYTSRSLLRCIDRGAKAFGWAEYDPKVGSMREGGELVGYGYATAMYPSMIGPAECRVTLTPGGRALVETGAHEIGTGVRTVIAQTAADQLGIGMGAVTVEVGDSAQPVAPLAGGSNSTASVCTVVAKACEQLRARLAKAAVKDKGGPLHGAQADFVVLRHGRIGDGLHSEALADAVRRAGSGENLVEEASNNPHGAPPLIGPMLARRGMPIIMGGTTLKDRVQFAFGAQFVEVRVDRDTGQIRVPRMVGAFAAGRIINPRTARSQLMGGQVWGLSSVLHEATEIDRRTARYVNDNLGEYHVPVNADVPHIETILLDERDDLVNPLGIKGVGELGITGVNAAVANAVYHATGVRVRELPIHLDKLLRSPLLNHA